MSKTKTVYVPRVRDTGKNPRHDGKAFRVRTHKNPAGQYGTRKWAEQIIETALSHDADLVRVGVGTEKIRLDDQAKADEWLTGDVRAISSVPKQYRDDYRESIYALANAAREYGEPLHINSGFRTLAQQIRAWENYLKGGPLAARPGTSAHERGTAFDISNAWTNKKLAKILRKHGFAQTVPSEKWHVQYVK